MLRGQGPVLGQDAIKVQRAGAGGFLQGSVVDKLHVPRRDGGIKGNIKQAVIQNHLLKSAHDLPSVEGIRPTRHDVQGIIVRQTQRSIGVMKAAVYIEPPA